MSDASTSSAAIPSSPPDAATRLAFENIYLAHERTQMSWVQVVLALISFGFTIAKVFQALKDQQGGHASLLGPRGVGILMIVIGLVALVLASIQHYRALRWIRSQCPGLPTSYSGMLAMMLLLLGTTALVSAFLRH